MSKDAEQNKSLGKGGKIAIFACVVVIILLLMIILFLFFWKQKDEEPKRNVVITPDNVEAVIDEMVTQEFVEPGYYSVSMTNTWHFATGDAVSEDAFVENKEENTNDVYFDVFLAENEETPILQSPVIPRGAEFDSIALDTFLEAGTYDCVMTYHLLDEKDETISTVRVSLTIVVKH